MSETKSISPWEEYSGHLKSLGYSPSTRAAYERAVAHFQNWLTFEKRSDISPETVRSFLENHLPQCRCLTHTLRCFIVVRGALNQLLLMVGLCRYHLAVDPDQAIPEISAIINDFDEYMRAVCGLSENTRWYRRRFARELMVTIFGKTTLDFASVTPAAITRFITERASSYKTGSVQVFTTSIRGFLKFLQFKGYTPASLIASVPQVPNWSLTRLPKSLDPNQLSQFLAAFERSSSIGKRDYAMARCFCDLGLRCGEVTSLGLDDFKWRDGLVKIHRAKSRETAFLPLPDKTGEALVDYLVNGRPETQSRAVFVYHRAPVGKCVQNTTVCQSMVRGFARAGLAVASTRILRHTVASRMLQGGASLKEIADLLGHQSIDTTMIYTKLNLSNLAEVALPWPGRRS